jgi:glutathione synthase/RimK-type ligase-like ATP-grasp enzyme
MATIAFVTSAALRDLYVDDLSAKAALEDRGHTVVPTVWNDPTAAWERFDLVVLRSPWDWYEQGERFRTWLAELAQRGVRVENRGAARWLEKTYLKGAEARGARIVPTEWVPAGDPRTLAEIVQARGFARAVVKPTLSANAHRTILFSANDAAAHEPHFRAIVAHGGAMVQPFFDEVRDPGEWALVFFDGRFSHALRKIAKPGDFRVQTDHGGTVAFEPAPPKELVAQALTALDAVRDGEPWPLYARVDGVVRDELLYVMELELVEPELFFRAQPEAPARFADAVERRIAARGAR